MGYRGKRGSFGNGMATVIKWDGVEVATVQSANKASPYRHTQMLEDGGSSHKIDFIEDIFGASKS